MAERIEYLGWVCEGKRNVRKRLTIVGDVIAESDKRIVVLDRDTGIQTTIRKGTILGREKSVSSDSIGW